MAKVTKKPRACSCGRQVCPCGSYTCCAVRVVGK